jgi:hypothetical protein
MGLGQVVEFGHHLDVTPAAEVGLDQLLKGGHPRFFQASRLGPSCQSVGNVGQGRPSPERQRLAQPRCGRLVVGSGGVLTSLDQKIIEAGGVESVALDPHQVAGRLGDHDRVTTCFSKGSAQARDEDSQRPAGCLLGLSCPEIFN